jgi:hypothetical protein
MSDLLVPIVSASFVTTTSVTRTTGTSTEYSQSVGVGGPVDQSAGLQGQADDTQWATDWLASDAAKEYEGKWVALSRDLVVLANGPSPSAIRDALGDQPGVAVLFVLPQNVVLVGGSRGTFGNPH